MVAIVLALAVLVAWSFPETDAGRWLHKHLVELPLEMGAKLERRHVLFVLVLLLCGQTLLMTLPLDFALVYAADVALYLDITATLAVASVVARAKAMLLTIRRSVARALFTVKSGMRRRSRGRTNVRTRPYRANDADEERAPRALARNLQRGLTNFSVIRSLSPMAA